MAVQIAQAYTFKQAEEETCTALVDGSFISGTFPIPRVEDLVKINALLRDVYAMCGDYGKVALWASNEVSACASFTKEIMLGAAAPFKCDKSDVKSCILYNWRVVGLYRDGETPLPGELEIFPGVLAALVWAYVPPTPKIMMECGGMIQNDDLVAEAKSERLPVLVLAYNPPRFYARSIDECVLRFEAACVSPKLTQEMYRMRIKLPNLNYQCSDGLARALDASRYEKQQRKASLAITELAFLRAPRPSV